MIFRSLPERLSEAEIDEMLAAADTDGDDYWIMRGTSSSDGDGEIW